MKSNQSQAVVLLALFFTLLNSIVVPSYACTTLGVGRKASKNGATFVTHSNDGARGTDPRVAYVPAKKFPSGSKRPVYPDIDDFPRFVGFGRGKTYWPRRNNMTQTKPIGYISQVEQTYAYLEASYGVQNEHQLSIGESTASAAFKAFAIGTPGGKALFCIDQLSLIALERCKSARCAVKLMGQLAEKHGFYGADGGAGESLFVSDPREVFVFHMLSDPTGTSAIWVAQRVPDEHVAVVANMFTIREVNLSDTFNFMGSDNMHDIAVKHRLWDGKGSLDFTRTFSYGEYTHQYYSGRRVWGALRLLKPSLKLDPTYQDIKAKPAYPFSVAPDHSIGVKELVAVHRSHYENTDFDTTKGVAAGPYGSPDRFETIASAQDIGVGSWERTIAIYRTSFSFVVQARESSPFGVVYFGTGDADKTVFVPMTVQSGGVSDEYRLGSPGKIDRRSFYWAQKQVNALVQSRYMHMIRDVREVQHEFEEKGAVLVESLEAMVNVSDSALRERLHGHAKQVRKAYLKLFDDLLLKYLDGYIVTDVAEDGKVEAHGLGYPSEWLKSSRFDLGPQRVKHPLVPPLAGQENPITRLK